jgi:hypothetical protein
VHAIFYIQLGTTSTHAEFHIILLILTLATVIPPTLPIHLEPPRNLIPRRDKHPRPERAEDGETGMGDNDEVPKVCGGHTGSWSQ